MTSNDIDLKEYIIMRENLYQNIPISVEKNEQVDNFITQKLNMIVNSSLFIAIKMQCIDKMLNIKYNYYQGIISEETLYEEANKIIN
jgi:hypothetical protein